MSAKRKKQKADWQRKRRAELRSKGYRSTFVRKDVPNYASEIPRLRWRPAANKMKRSRRQ